MNSTRLQFLLDKSLHDVLNIQEEVYDFINGIDLENCHISSSLTATIDIITSYAKRIEDHYICGWRHFEYVLNECGVFSYDSIGDLLHTIDVSSLHSLLCDPNITEKISEKESLAISLKKVLFQYNEKIGDKIASLASRNYKRACKEIHKVVESQQYYEVGRKVAESFSPLIKNLNKATNHQQDKTISKPSAPWNGGGIIGAVDGSAIGLFSSIFNLFGDVAAASAACSKIGCGTGSLNHINTLPEPKKVDAAIYAPSEAMRGVDVLVQMYLYEQKDSSLVAALASQIDPDAKLRNYTPLSQLIKRGDKVRIEMKAYGGITLEESCYETQWNDTMLKHEFVLSIPDSFSKRDFLCSVSIFINDIPVGDMKFKTNIVDDKPQTLWAEVKSHKYKRSFISYSHADADKIRFLAEGFKIQGIDYFFDEHSLRTGDNYPKEIDEYILSCDVFVLCWSKNAKTSDWVLRECKLALQRYDNKSGDLRIYPLSITPKADLPSILQDKFHFGQID